MGQNSDPLCASSPAHQWDKLCFVLVLSAWLLICQHLGVIHAFSHVYTQSLTQTLDGHELSSPSWAVAMIDSHPGVKDDSGVLDLGASKSFCKLFDELMCLTLAIASVLAWSQIIALMGLVKGFHCPIPSLKTHWAYASRAPPLFMFEA
jgi:hypothetical protein